MNLRPILSVLLAIVLAARATPARADNPLLAPVYAMVAIAAVGAAVVVADKFTGTETTEETEEGEMTDRTDTGDDSDDESSGENEGSEGLAGNNSRPVIVTTTESRGGWYEGAETQLVFGGRVPSSLLPSQGRTSLAAAAAKTTIGTGIQYKDAMEEANVLNAPANVKAVRFRKIRRASVLVQRTRRGTRDLKIPLRLKIDQLLVSTTDVPRTDGHASATIRLLADGQTLFSVSGSVAQGQAPQFQSTAPIAGLVDAKAGKGTLRNLDRTIIFTLPKNRNRAKLVLEYLGEGEGRRI